jgi:hypothetical protein
VQAPSPTGNINATLALPFKLRRWRGDPNVTDARKPNESMAMIARRIPQNMIESLALYLESV